MLIFFRGGMDTFDQIVPLKVITIYERPMGQFNFTFRAFPSLLTHLQRPAMYLSQSYYALSCIVPGQGSKGKVKAIL